MRYIVMKVVPSIVGTWETLDASTTGDGRPERDLGALRRAKSICVHRAAGNPGVQYRVREVEVEMPDDDVSELPMLYSALLKVVDNTGGV